jgi:YidC/Oxa1 family membrane protein insertase
MQPLLNLLVFLYNILWGDIGLAIIAITVIIRLILYPSFKHQLESQKKLAELQPKLKELQSRYKDNREEQSKAMMKFYRENKVNPFGSCLPLIIQLLILIALFQVFRTGLNGAALENLYSFVTNPGSINTLSLGFLELSTPNIILAFITGGVQYFQSKLMMRFQPKPAAKGSGGTADMGSMISKQMIYVLPVITVIFGAQLPAGLTLYWLITTLFMLGQQYIIIRSKKAPAAS